VVELCARYSNQIISGSGQLKILRREDSNTLLLTFRAFEIPLIISAVDSAQACAGNSTTEGETNIGTNASWHFLTVVTT